MGVIVASPTNHFKLNGLSGFINDSGSCGSFYVDNYASQGCTLNAGTAYTYTTGGGGSIGYGLSEQIWIDFNNDGTFQTSESVGGITSYNATTAAPTGTITIPAGSAAIAPGTYRMRVEVILPGTGYPNMSPCPVAASPYNYGEVRDYFITLNVPPVASASPTSLSFPLTTTSTSSATMSSTITALYLSPSSGNLTVTAPTRFAVNNGTSWLTSYSVAYTGGSATFSVPVQFNPTTATTSSGNVTITGGGLSTLNVAVTGTGANPCSGTPVAGTASATPAAGASTSAFTLNLTGYSAVGGLTFQWQSTTDTTTGYTDISGATNTTYSFTGVASDMYYRCRVTCVSSSVTTSTWATKITYITPSSCVPTFSLAVSACTGGTGLYIASPSSPIKINGAIGSINDATSCNGTGYFG